jgi:hypothetical protein
MSFRKKNSEIILKAKRRSLSIGSISTTFKVSDDVTFDKYEQVIVEADKAQNDYNEQLRLADEKSNILDDSLSKLKDWNERMLEGVGSVYGKNSNEYEKAGGVRKTDRKRRSRKEKKPIN